VKVAIVAPTPVPFTRGGAERAWAGLHAALLDAGHDAELVKLPVPERTLAEIGRGYRAFAALDLSHFDVVISSKYPAWICPHPRHVLWMFHPLRGLYDTYHLFGLPTDPGPVEPPTARLLDAVAGPPERSRVAEVLDALDAAVAALGEGHPDLALPGPVSRAVVHWLDRTALAPSQIERYAALSRTVAVRTGYLPSGVEVRVAHAPSDLPAPDPTVTLDDPTTFFTASRLDGPKRIDLVVDAMAHVPGDATLAIGGSGPDEAALRARAASDPRIRFLGFVPDDELSARYAAATAVPFVPLDEDYGLITVEAMAVATPVVTTTDSGGVAELVRDEVDGLIVPPDAARLGAALTALAADPERAARMGAAGRRRTASITWPAVVRTLLGPADARRGSTASATIIPPAPRSPKDTRRPNDTSDPNATTTGGTATAGPAPADAATPRRQRRGRARRPRVVALTTFRVGDRAHGGQLRAFHLYGGMARHVDVEIVSLSLDRAQGRTELAPGLVETNVAVSPAHRRAADERTLAAGIPMSDLVAGSHIDLTPAYLTALRDAARDADVAIVAEPYLFPALGAAGVTLPFVYDAFNVETTLKAEAIPPSPHRREVLAAVEDVERRAATGAAAIVACSADDARELTAMAGRPSAHAVVVPNGTDCAAVVPRPVEVRRRAAARWLTRYRDLRPGARDVDTLAVFFGSWHPPNLMAAEIVMSVAGEAPEALFVMGGHHGEAFSGHRPPPNVVFTGRVRDGAKRALLGAADVAINPMATGSGTNLKIVEYLAAGVPVVTSTVGARGLDVDSGVHLLVTDDLPAGVAEVRAAPEAAAERARAGRRLVEDRYDWSALSDRLLETVRRVARR